MPSPPVVVRRRTPEEVLAALNKSLRIVLEIAESTAAARGAMMEYYRLHPPAPSVELPPDQPRAGLRGRPSKVNEKLPFALPAGVL